MKYPFAAILPPYILGLLAARVLMPAGWPALPWLFFLSICTALGTLTLARWRPWLLTLLLFFCGWVNLAWQMAVLAPDDIRHRLGATPQLTAVRGILAEPPSFRITEKYNTPKLITDSHEELDPAEFHSLVTLKLSEVCLSNQWRRASGQLLLSAPFRLADSFQDGSRVEVLGVLQQPPGPAAEGLFDYQAFLQWLGIYGQLRTDTPGDWKLTAPPAHGSRWTSRFFHWAQATLARGLPAEDEPLRLLWAMTLGWKTALTSEVSEPFMRTGTMHIFAVSGLHIVLIAGVLMSLLRLVRVPRAWCGAVVIPLLWFYTGASGWQASAIRSSLMMTLVIGGWSLRRPGNLLNSLGAAGFIILLYDPRQLFQASFQLSFLVVFSIGWLSPVMEQWRSKCLRGDPLLPAELRPAWRRALDRPLHWLFTSLATSLSAWLGSALIIAYYFHLFTPVSLLANLIIVPLSSVALACNVGALMCGAWWPWATEIFNHSAWFWMWLLTQVNDYLAKLPGAYFYVRAPARMDFVAGYALIFGVIGAGWWAARWRKWLGLGFMVYAALCGYRWHAASQSARLEVLALPGGDAIWINTPGSRLLIDGGNERAARRLTKPFLAAQGINRLPCQLVTHGDIRHCGSAEMLREEFGSRQIVVGHARYRSPEFREALEIWEAMPHRLRTVTAGDFLGPWEVLHPRAGEKFSLADDVPLVLRANLRGTTVLLCSDLSLEGQSNLLNREADLRADIVVAGIPSRGEPLGEAMLDRVKPRLIILSCAYYPVPEQARASLRERLAQRGIPVLYTCDTGSVTIEFRPSSYKIKTMNLPRT